MTQKAIVFPVNGVPQVIDFTGGLDQLQKIVDGCIEPLPQGDAFAAVYARELNIDLFQDAPANCVLCVLVNEDGFSKQLPVNHMLTYAFGQIVIGNAVIVALD